MLLRKMERLQMDSFLFIFFFIVEKIQSFEIRESIRSFHLPKIDSPLPPPFILIISKRQTPGRK